MKNIEKIPKSEFLSKYEHWLLTDTNKSTSQNLKPTTHLSEIEKIHTTSIPIAVNNRKTVLNDLRIDKINSNLLNYDGTLATSLNCVQDTKKTFQSFETNIESMHSMQLNTHINSRVKQKFLNIRNDKKMASIYIQIVCFIFINNINK